MAWKIGAFPFQDLICFQSISLCLPSILHSPLTSYSTLRFAYFSPILSTNGSIVSSLAVTLHDYSLPIPQSFKSYAIARVIKYHLAVDETDFPLGPKRLEDCKWCRTVQYICWQRFVRTHSLSDRISRSVADNKDINSLPNPLTRANSSRILRLCW